MLTMVETRETTKHLSAHQLREWARVCKELRFFYRHGKWKKGSNPATDHCTLCALAELNLFEVDTRSAFCVNCPWMMLENKTCVGWFKQTKSAFPINPMYISRARLNRVPWFTATRIQMLDKWVRRLNALAATRRF